MATEVEAMLSAGERWLIEAQQPDGGWSAGTTATAEETALAVIALAGGSDACVNAARRGQAWLVASGRGEGYRPSPIGLYFSLLWYHEKLYPLVWPLDALSSVIS